MTRDEQKAVTFVAILLSLALVARFMNRPKPMTITAGAVDLEAYQAAGQALARQPPGRPSRSRKKPAVAAAAEPPAPPPRWTEPAWRRGGGPPVLIEETRPSGSPSRAGPLNLNTATAAQIEALPGVGPAMAQRIIAKRDSVGRFGSLADLDAVKGIGPALLAKLKPLVVVR